VNDNTNARIEVVNTLGQHIATLGEGYLAEGTHTLNWSGHDDNGTPVANGVYLVRLTTDAGQSGVVRVMMQR
jgi:flagellar hook assembly protein FlgD